MLSIAFRFQRWSSTVTMAAPTAHNTDGSSESGCALKKSKSVVRSRNVAQKSTAIEIAGMNFSMKPKKAGTERFRKTMNGSKRSKSIMTPMQSVAMRDSIAVNFIFCLLW